MVNEFVFLVNEFVFLVNEFVFLVKRSGWSKKKDEPLIKRQTTRGEEKMSSG